MSASRIANVAGTAACVVAGAIAGQSVHRVPEGHHVVVRPHAELTGQLPTSVLPPGWHLCPRLPGLHQAVLVPTEPSEHCVTALADTKPGRRGDCYRVEMASTLVVAPDVGQLASENSAALGGPQLVERAVGVVGRAALTTLAAACTAPELAAPEPALRFLALRATVENQLRHALGDFGLQLVSLSVTRTEVEPRYFEQATARQRWWWRR